MYLKALRPVKRIRSHFWTFDTETESLKGEKFVIACLYEPPKQKGKAGTYHLFNNVTEIFDFLIAYSQAYNVKSCHGRYINIFVHNLTFDIRFLLDHCAKHNNGVSFGVISSGSKDLVVEFTINDFKFRFIDSVQLTLISQEKLEQTLLGQVIKYKDIDFEGPTKPSRTEYIRRVKSDVIGLYKSLKVYFKLLFKQFSINTNDRKLISLSRLSLKAFRTKFINKPLFNPFCDYNYQTKTYKIRFKKLLLKIYSSYFGGRTEILKRGYYKKVNAYDINSLYPFVFSKDYPIGKVRKKTVYSLAEFQRSLDLYEGFIDGEVEELYSEYPILPGKDTENRTVFSYGLKKGVYCFPEIRYGLTQKLFKFKFPLDLILFKRGDFFNGFGEKCFAERLKYQNKDNPIQYPLKIIMNSLYGKFGQRLTQESQTYLSASDYVRYMCGEKTIHDFIPKSARRVKLISKGDIHVFKYENTNIKPFYMPHIATYVTSYARIELLKVMLKNKDKLCYVDTDSIWTIGEANVNLGDKIGEWKLERTCQETAFLALKCYAYMTDELVIRIKGVTKQMIQRANFLSVTDFLSRVTSYVFSEPQRYNTIKTSLIRHNSFLSSNKRTKEITASYSKRIVLENGDTLPHNYNIR